MPNPVDKLVSDLKVLVVDDNVEMCNTIRRMLLDFGILHVFTAKSGKEAVDFLNTSEDGLAADMVLCDWNMPGMTGIELLRQIRSCDPDVPFIMITGKSDKDSVVEARAHGVTGYIAKPFSPDALHKKLSVVARMLAQRREMAPAS
jgi:CheY-like chemotaxis protein